MNLTNQTTNLRQYSSIILVGALLMLGAILLASGSASALASTRLEVNARNAERRHDVNTMQSKIRSFSNKKVNHRFPSLTELNNNNWVTSNLPTLPLADLADPTFPDVLKLSAYPVKGQYAYMVTDANGSSCEATSANCSDYSISATYEGFVKGAGTYTVSGKLKP